MEDLKKIKQDGYYISTPEFALMLNISTEALRSRRRRGELKGQYKFDGKKYWWQGLRPDTVKKIRNNRPVVRVSRSNIKRKRRRGAHIRGDETLYPNHAFKVANELKMLNRIKSEVPESVINEINPELIKLAQDKLLKKREQIQKDLWTPPKTYGGMLRGYSINFEHDLENKRRDYQYEHSERERQKRRDNSFYLNSHSRNNSGGAYNIGEPDDDGSVEVPILETSPGDSNIERQPINKVQESILRLEIENLKNGR